PRHAPADVLARGRPAELTRAAQTAADDALAVDRPARRRDARLRHAWRRHAGPVVAALLPLARPVRPERAGGDRRADLPHRTLPGVLLPAAGAAAGRPDRGPFRPEDAHRAGAPRPPRRAAGAVVARSRECRRPRPRGLALCGGKPSRHAGLRSRALALGALVLHDPDEVALRVGELAQHDHPHDVLGAHHALPAEALGLLQRFLDVGHGDVEGDVPAVALRALADAAADADVAVGGLVVLAVDHPVVHRVVAVDLPAEQLAVVLLQLLAVLADDLEVHDCLAHLVLLSLGVTWLDDERDPNSSTRERRKGPLGPSRMSPWSATQIEAHWPFLAPVTWLSEPSESPICGAGELPKQLRLPWIVFVTYSFPSGSASTLPLRLTAPFTWLRMKPIKNPL